MQALLAEVPAVGRILRPLCRMLGVEALEPVQVKAVVVRKARAPKPRVAREKPWSPGPIRPLWTVGGETGFVRADVMATCSLRYSIIIVTNLLFFICLSGLLSQ